MFGKWLSNKQESKRLSIASPMTGKAVPLENVPDEAFAAKHMGDGVAIEPAEGRVVAPFDGIVAHLIRTRHAIILEHESGVQLLIHIGVNTVGLKGKGFRAFVENGAKVKQGDTLIEFDLEEIREAGYAVITPVIIANGNETVEQLEAAFKDVVAGEPSLLQAALKE